MGIASKIQKAYLQGKTPLQILALAQKAAGAKGLDREVLGRILEIAQGGSLGDQEALKRAAIPRWFNREVYEAVLSDKMSPAFASFINRSDVAQAPQSGYFCLTETARERSLEGWDKAELKKFAAKLVRHFKARDDSENVFASLLFANPLKARNEFLRLYRVLDENFDYVALDDLLCVLRDRQEHISRALYSALGNREQYYQSRTLYSEDWTKSEQYLKRPELLKEFNTFFRDKNAFLMHLHAPGGSGKTAFLQWLVSRYAIIESGPRSHRIPVGKVDLDQTEMAAVRIWPWLPLTLPIRQLNLQLRNTPLDDLATQTAPLVSLVRRGGGGQFAVAESIASTLSNTIFNDLAKQLGAARCLIILDTVEELMLHLPVQFGVLIDGLASVRGRCPGLRVLISGRYPADEVEQSSAAVSKLAPGWFRTSIVKPFSDLESRKYLAQIRGLKNSRLIEKIVRHSSLQEVKKGKPVECTPFKLSLFADLAETPSGITNADFRNPAVSYLIKRIIERIPKEEFALRWTLRYAVIPRELTPEFFDAVLKSFLEVEIAGVQSTDDTSTGLPSGQRTPWKYFHDGKVQRHPLWTALRKYAGPRSWVRFVGDIPQLQPEVVKPMRWLLRKSASMFYSLHTSAIRYFEGLANETGEDWTRWTVDAVYHRFQRDGIQAIRYWSDLLDKHPKAQDLNTRRQLCELLVSGDFVDDFGNLLKDPETGAALIDLAALARARLELASACVQRARNADPGERGRLLEDAVRHFDELKRVERLWGKKIPDSGSRAHIEASLAVYRGDYKRAFMIADQFLAEDPQSPYAVPLLVLSAETGSLTPDEAAGFFQRAAKLAAASKTTPLLSEPELRRREAKVWMDAGDLPRAAKTAVRSRLTETLVNIALQAGDLETLAKLLSVPSALSPPVRFHANAYLRLAEGLSEYWLSENGRPLSYESANEPERLVELTVWRARALCDLFNAKQAFEEIESLSASLRESRPHLVEILTLEKAQLCLDALGDRRGARSLLDISNVSPSNLNRYDLLLLKAESNRHAELWPSIRTSRSLSQWDETEVLAHWIGFGRPRTKDWPEFVERCSTIQPEDARYAPLQTFLYAPLSSRLRTVAEEQIWPRPQPGPNLLPKALALASCYAVMGDFPASQRTLSWIPWKAALTNVVLLYRYVRVARRGSYPLDKELVATIDRMVGSNANKHPALAAVTSLELANWQLRESLLGDARRSLIKARDLMAGSGGRFEGRYIAMYSGMAKGVGITQKRAVSTNKSPVLESTPGIPMMAPERLSYDGPTLSWTRVAERLSATANASLYVTGDRAGELPESNLPTPRPLFFRREIQDAEVTRLHEAAVAGWFQEALKGAGFPVEPTGDWSAPNQTQLLKAAADLKLGKPDWTQWEPKQALRKARKSDPAVLMFRESFKSERSRKRGYGARGLDVVKEMKLPHCLFWKPEHSTTLQVDRQINLFWFVGHMRSSSTGIYLEIKEGTLTFRFSAHQLSQTFGAQAMRVPSMVFLDIYDDPDREQQASLRNRFAHSLYSLGKVRSVLAGGLVSGDLKQYLRTLRASIEANESEGAMAQAIAPFSLAPALYSVDPTVPFL